VGTPTQVLTLTASTIFSYLETNFDGKVVVGSADNLVSSYEIDIASLQTFTCSGTANQVAITDDGLTLFTLCSSSPQVQIYSRTSPTTNFTSLTTFDLPGSANAAGHMLKINSLGNYLFLSDGTNSFEYVNSLGSYNLQTTYSNTTSVAFSDDATYIWRDIANVGHSAECLGFPVETITYNTIEPLYREVVVASDGSSILAFGENPMSIDYFFLCSIANCLSCLPTACLICQSPFVAVGGACITCSLPYCAICSSSTQCQTCNPSFTISANFSCGCAVNNTLSTLNSQCVSCSVSFCIQCDFSNICSTCNSTFVLSAGICKCPASKQLSTSSVCVNCSVVGCKTCSTDNFCFSCLTTFALVAGTCKCPANTTLSINASFCAICFTVFCKRCDINNVCASCNSTFTQISGTCLCAYGSVFNSTSSTCDNYTIQSASASSNQSEYIVFILAGIASVFGVAIVGMIIYIRSLQQVQPPPEGAVEPTNQLRTTEKMDFKL
jgi:hypothetical protein